MPPPRTSAVAHPSESSAQRDAERIAVGLLSRDLGAGELAPARLELPGGSYVSIDGFGAGPPVVLVEVFAHLGALKGGQPHKVMADACKLWTASTLLFAGAARSIVVLTDQLAAASVRKSWRGAALAALGVEVSVVALPQHLARRVRDAQQRQFMTNAQAMEVTALDGEAD